MKLLYISNDINEVKKIDRIGIDFIFIDLEINGKKERQGHLDTFISNHNIEDVKKIKEVLKNAKLLVRVNPIGIGSEEEINKVIEYGADVIMLPMFKTKEEVEKFILLINKRAKVCLLLETSEAFFRINDILLVEGIDYIHIGLNDLHLSLGLDFMFECLAGDLMEHVVNKIARKGIEFGIGGIARIGEGELPSEVILKEHVRLGSKMAILSRTFRDGSKELEKEIIKIREEYKKDLLLTKEELLENKKKIDKIVNEIAYKRTQVMLYRRFGKRVIDMILSFLGIILLSPLFLIISILIKIDSKGPVIFKHKRLGKNCKPIYVLKFRTMVDNAVSLGPQYTSSNDTRITKIGKFLRNTSLDELTQLFNILKGDMSIIGPRPDAYTDNPTDIQRKRTEVLPGITGLAQVNGRSNLNEEARGNYDLEYIEKYNFIYDLKIFIKTILIVILRKGTN